LSFFVSFLPKTQFHNAMGWNIYKGVTLKKYIRKEKFLKSRKKRAKIPEKSDILFFLSYLPLLSYFAPPLKLDIIYVRSLSIEFPIVRYMWKFFYPQGFWTRGMKHGQFRNCIPVRVQQAFFPVFAFIWKKNLMRNHLFNKFL
jgi:hypothetical protein